ncbi:MAG: S26 family signal peptidase [Solirubrobacteraceae bacterium]|jgi:hypothetical protein
MAGKAAATKPSLKRSKSVTRSIVELVVIVLVALGLALGIEALIIKPYRIPSGSMEPTLIEGQRLHQACCRWPRSATSPRRSGFQSATGS